METLSLSECDVVGGGSALSLFGVLIQIIADATPLRSFFDGLFDGAGGI